MSSSKDALSPAVQPLLVVLMGVSGTGKSTLAGAIAARSAAARCCRLGPTLVSGEAGRKSFTESKN